MAADSAARGFAWSAIPPGVSREAPPPAPAHRGNDGGGRKLPVGEVSEAAEVLDAEGRYEIPVEVSGEGERLPPVVDGFEAPAARCVRCYAMQGAMGGREFMACAGRCFTASARSGFAGMAVAFSIPGLSELAAAGGSAGRLEGTAKPRAAFPTPATGSAQEPVSTSRVLNHSANAMNGGKKQEIAMQTADMDPTTKLNIKKVLRKCHSPTGSRMWIVSLVMIVLLAQINLASSLDHDANMENICPVTLGQSKRVCPGDDWISKSKQTSNLKIGNEFRDPKKKSNCRKQSTDEMVGSALGAFVSLVINLVPWKSIFKVASLSPDKRKILCISSLLLFASNLSWIVYMGAEVCRNPFSFISVLIGFGLHGYYSWFFWQRKYNTVLCFMPAMAFAMSITITVISYFTAVAQFMRIGPESYLGRGIPAAVAGIVGLLSTGKGIHYHMKSMDSNYSRSRLIIVICGIVGLCCSMYGIHWKQIYLLLCYKIAITILFGARVYEMFQLLFFSCYGPPQTTGSNENNYHVPLLQSTSSIMSGDGIGAGNLVLVPSNEGAEENRNNATPSDTSSPESEAYGSGTSSEEDEAYNSELASQRRVAEETSSIMSRDGIGARNLVVVPSNEGAEENKNNATSSDNSSAESETIGSGESSEEDEAYYSEVASQSRVAEEEAEINGDTDMLQATADTDHKKYDNKIGFEEQINGATPSKSYSGERDRGDDGSKKDCEAEVSKSKEDEAHEPVVANQRGLDGEKVEINGGQDMPLAKEDTSHTKDYKKTGLQKPGGQEASKAGATKF